MSEFSYNQAAHTFFHLIPPSLAPDFLLDYGLEVSQDQAQSITWEILLLSSYWIRCATHAGIPQEAGEAIWEGVLEQIRNRWENRFGFVHRSIDQFFEDMKHKFEAWHAITQQGGEPIAILTKVASDLESEGVIPRGEEQKLLVLFLDLVPIEEIGQVAAEIEQGISPDSLPF